MAVGTDGWSRAARLLFCGLMTGVWAGAFDPARSRAADPPTPTAAAVAPAADPAAAPADPTPESLRRQADALEAQARAFAAIDKALPRDTFEPEAVVKAVGNDPAKLFEWVRDRTAYVPYRGALRNSFGVLMDRAGNSLDRALLLAHLLTIAGSTARLVHAQLPADKVDALLKAAWDDPASAAPNPAGDDVDDALIDKLAGELHVDAKSVRRGIERRDLVVQANQETLQTATADQSGRLLKLLAPVAAAFKPAEDRQRQAAAAADHWWVQRQDGDRWIDLDPTLRTNKPGDAPAADPAVLPPAAPGQPPAVDAALWHAVEIRVVAERFDGRAVSRSVVLKHAFRPAFLVGRPATLALVGLAPPPVLDPDAPDPAAVLRSALADQKEWVPVLRIGTAQVVQGSVDETGTVNPNPPLDALAGTGATIAKGLGAASAALNALGNDAPAPADPGVLSGVWVEFETRTPGEAPAVVTRPLFDAVGPAKRAAGPVTAVAAPDPAGRVARAAALNARLDVLATGCALSEEYVTHLALRNSIDNAPAVAKALRTTGSTKDAFAAVAKADPLPAALLTLAAGRRGPAGTSPCALDRTNLIGQWSTLAVVDGKDIRPRKATDLIATHTAARGAAAAGFAGRLRQGVMETRLEPMALPGSGPGQNTAGLFAAAAGSPDWVLVRGPDDPALKQLRLGDDAALARVSTDLRDGYAVVVPATPVSVGGAAGTVGWWRIDPRDGSCVGMMANGMGASMAEYALLTVVAVSTGINTYAGCGGFATGASSGKKLGCAACGAISAALTLLGGAGAIGLAGAAGKAAAGLGGFAAGNVAGNACNAFSAIAS